MFGKKNIVIFAAGGGNDIFSAIAYVKAYLCNYEFNKIAIVSVLGFTPFHSNEEIKPNCLNIELSLIKPTNNMCRYLPFHNPKEIFCLERLFPEILKDIAPEIINYVCMSPKYSAIDQAVNLNKLFDEWEMKEDDTLLNIVDFGGDILTNGLQSSIISPELDAYTLAVVKNLINYSSKISICFPGVDGELSKDYLSACCDDNNSNINSKHLIDEVKWHNILTKIYDKLKNKRSGNTIPNMLNVLDAISLNTDCKCNLFKKWIIGKQCFRITKEVDIDLNLQKYVYIFDTIDNNPFTNIFNDIDYDLIKVIKHINNIYDFQAIDNNTFQSSDFYLQFLRKDLNDKWSNKHLIYDDNINGKWIQQVMIVDIIPHAIINEKDIMHVKIGNLKTFDVLYSMT